jgi:hypothetical protein
MYFNFLQSQVNKWPDMWELSPEIHQMDS